MLETTCLRPTSWGQSRLHIATVHRHCPYPIVDCHSHCLLPQGCNLEVSDGRHVLVRLEPRLGCFPTSQIRLAYIRDDNRYLGSKRHEGFRWSWCSLSEVPCDSVQENVGIESVTHLGWAGVFVCWGKDFEVWTTPQSPESRPDPS